MITFYFLKIQFGVSVGFAGLICLMLYIDRSGLLIPSILATLIHEAGHVFCLMIFKSDIKKIHLKIGAVGVMGNFYLSPKNEILMTLAGPISNILFFAVFLFLYNFEKTIWILNFSLINLVLGVFNLLPIMGLDGGSIVYLLLCFCKSKTFAKKISLVLSLVTIFVLCALGTNIFIKTKNNPTLILLSLYLFLGVLLSKKQKND